MLNSVAALEKILEVPQNFPAILLLGIQPRQNMFTQKLVHKYS